MGAGSLYHGHDPRDLPAYTVAEAARYLHIPPATLRSWLVGRTYPRQNGMGEFEPLIRPANPVDVNLSFSNLVEAHVLRALRTRHGISIAAVRPAIRYAEQELSISRLLLSDELRTHAGDLFLIRLGELINLTKSGQLALRKVLEAHLQRVERDERAIPLRLYPFITGSSVSGRRNVVIDPVRSFGRPSVAGHGVATRALAQRIDAGESVEALADDYDIPREVIEEAIVFEQAA